VPTLTFDFPDPATGRPERATFRDPTRVVVAGAVDEVTGALEEVERAVADGLYAAGYVAYEAAPAFEPRMRVREGGRLPLVWFGLYDAPAASSTSTLTSSSSPASTSTPASTPAATDADRAAASAPGLRTSDWRLEMDRGRYDAAVATVREAIADGRTYQVNLTARLRATVEEGPVAVYESLRRAQGAGYHALLDLGERVIVSVSPELFFRTTGRAIETRPMKGTRPRGRWPEEDEALAAELVVSEKDRAENLMIVDLLRSDLGRVCETGSIRVPRLYEVERYRTVWQLTSTIEGRLREGVGLTTLLAALFPCGSVTGAPKISTMEIIAGLEASPREVYCGAIGMIRPGGDAVFSVPIRTLWWDRATGEAEYGTGGGIVWDSTADAEYDELLTKALVVREPWPEFELLETMASEDGAILRLDRHLERLRRSAEAFGFAFPEAAVRSAIEAAAAAVPAEAQKVRLTLGPDGTFEVAMSPLGFMGDDGPAGSSEPMAVALATGPVRSGDRFLYHKTTHRAAYDRRRAEAPDAYDVVLWNERGELTELTRGNLVLELDGQLMTPHLAAGLLAGCLRAELLDASVIQEAVLWLEDMARATRVWSISSARRWVPLAITPPRAVDPPREA
jgi:para-aminobenzoate synthetase / 4-amino-4-deoxychorismate lyase